MANSDPDTSTFSFRSECIDDIDMFIDVCGATGISLTVSNIYEPTQVLSEFAASATLDELQDLMRIVPDGHVMLQTLRQAPLSENSLERDYTLV